MPESLKIIDKIQKLDAITLTIRNNTTAVQQAHIMGNPNLQDNSNALRSFNYALAGESYATTSISITYKANNQTSYQTASLPLLTQSIQGVVDALNGLGIGTWYYSGTDVITYNDDYIFSTLLITAAVIPTPGAVDTSFVYGTGFDNTVNAIAIQTDGKILVGGTFTSYNGTGANRIIRLNTDGTVDGSFVYGTGFDNDVTAIKIQPDGKIIIAGSFTTYNGAGISFITRVDTGGVVDGGFSTGVGFNAVINTIDMQADNKIIVGGNFSTGLGSSKIARLNTNGTEDATFASGTGFDFVVNALKIDATGNVVVGGSFSTYNGTGANRIIRLTTLGAVDGTFVYGTGFSASVNAITIQTDGKILVGGSFATYNGTGANWIVRLTTLGAIDGTFVYGTGFSAASFVSSIAVQADGKIVIAGGFTAYNGTLANFIIRVTTLGAVDASFIYGTGFDTITNTLAIQTDTNILVGGNFTSYDGTAANFIIRLIG